MFMTTFCPKKRWNKPNTARQTILAWALPGLMLVFPCQAWSAVDFNRDIRPILSNACYECHGPDEQQRQGGDPDQGGLRFDIRESALADLGGLSAIVPGQPANSELVRRITSTDPDEMMPPPDHRVRLSNAQKEMLTGWIRQGAPWSAHWAYEPPHRVSPQIEAAVERGHNWIDQFVSRHLQSHGLTMSPRADSRVLARRLHFDLVGLPPRPSAVHALVNDNSQKAWERLVDRLLAAPQFAERMAIYWLDLVRYADTVGYHGDQPVSISPYRDYVIRAFNENIPFDRFTVEQLAGDLLPEPTQWQLIASGYNRLGMMSAEGGVQDKEYLAKYAAERVRTASTVWLGSTLGCAECHDHKFDPFSTRDFYRFAAFFADIKEKGLYRGANGTGDWGPKIEVADSRRAELLKPIDDQIKRLQRILDKPTSELRDAQLEWERQLGHQDAEWIPLAPIRTAALNKTELSIQDDHSVLASGPSPQTETYTIDVETELETVSGFRLEVLPHPSLPKRGPGRSGNGNFVLTEIRVAVVSPGADQPQPIKLRNASASTEQTHAATRHPDKIWSAASTIDDDKRGSTWGWAILPVVGKASELVVETTDVLSVTRGTKFTFELQQNHSNSQHTIGRFRLSATSAAYPVRVDRRKQLPPEIRQILALPAAGRTADQQESLAAHYRTIAPRLEATRQKLSRWNKQRSQVMARHTRSSLITVAVPPREIRVLPRGNWMDDSGEIVQPGVPEFLGQLDSSGRASRLDLARWLTSPENPLTARVMVNRLWKMMFGTGLSKALDDLGSQGESPVNAELLDALAVEFMESGWNIKHIVKLMVTSRAYQQSSLPRPEVESTDPYNRLLARQSRFRLDAEMIRDNALAVSGLLVREIGGASTKPYQPAGLYRHLNFPKRKYQHDQGKNQYRRGLYTHWQRQFLHPAMKSFDAPSREECTAERARSNTPLAALVLLNDPSYVEAARMLAEQALRAVPESDQRRIDWIMQHALNRAAWPEERKLLLELQRNQQKRFARDPSAAKQLVSIGLAARSPQTNVVQLAAWTSVTRTVLNMHEFINRN